MRKFKSKMNSSKNYRLLFFAIVFLMSHLTFAQNGLLKGKVVDKLTGEGIPFANLLLENTQIGTTTDFEGNFRIENIKPGVYTLICSVVGYERFIKPEITIGNSLPVTIQVEMNQSVEKLEDVEITASPFIESEESPVSLRNINSTEIIRNPGGNRDISKVIQTLPGVATTVSFRNDIIVRGGSPNENRFYLDDIEVPNINHFATQGSSGGPVGMINVNFIREVNFYAGAFPANRGNALR